MGTSHSTKTFSLNFRQLPQENGTAFSKISKKEANLATYNQIFEKKFKGSFLSIHDQLCSRNFENSHFENSTAFRISATFCEKFLYHLPLFPNFRKFWLNGKRPLSPRVKPVFSSARIQLLINRWSQLSPLY